MDNQESTQVVTLKDYIIDLAENPVKPAIRYEVVLENNTDYLDQP